MIYTSYVFATKKRAKNNKKVIYYYVKYRFENELFIEKNRENSAHHVTVITPVSTLMQDLNANGMLDIMIMVSAGSILMNVAFEPITAVNTILVKINLVHFHAIVKMMIHR